MKQIWWAHICGYIAGVRGYAEGQHQILAKGNSEKHQILAKEAQKNIKSLQRKLRKTSNPCHGNSEKHQILAKEAQKNIKSLPWKLRKTSNPCKGSSERTVESGGEAHKEGEEQTDLVDGGRASNRVLDMERSISERGAREGVERGERRFGIGCTFEGHDHTAAGSIRLTDIGDMAERQERASDLRERNPEGGATIRHKQMRARDSAAARLAEAHHPSPSPAPPLLFQQILLHLLQISSSPALQISSSSSDPKDHPCHITTSAHLVIGINGIESGGGIPGRFRLQILCCSVDSDGLSV
jgi:hypothetical protein